jgi:hypothetical protein
MRNRKKSRKKAADAKAVRFKRLYGVNPVTFHKMLSILQKEFDILHKNGGKPPKLTVEGKLYITLKYLREYRMMDSIAAEYGVCKGTICLSIQWVEDTLVQDGTFALPGKKSTETEIGINLVRCGGCHGKSHKPSERRSKSVLFGKKTPYAEAPDYY